MIEESMKLLKKYKYKLSEQQYKTFKGQILSGDIDGFKKGLKKVLNNNKKELG